MGGGEGKRAVLLRGNNLRERVYRRLRKGGTRHGELVEEELQSPEGPRTLGLQARP